MSQQCFHSSYIFDNKSFHKINNKDKNNNNTKLMRISLVSSETNNYLTLEDHTNLISLLICLESFKKFLWWVMSGGWWCLNVDLA